MAQLLKIAEQEHPDSHIPNEDIKQWLDPAVDTQLNQAFHTQFQQQSVQLSVNRIGFRASPFISVTNITRSRTPVSDPISLRSNSHGQYHPFTLAIRIHSYKETSHLYSI